MTLAVGTSSLYVVMCGGPTRLDGSPSQSPKDTEGPGSVSTKPGPRCSI
jgi:hypothetical protein